MKSFPLDAMKLKRKNVVPEELRNTEVDSKVRRYEEVEKFRSGMFEDSANNVLEVPPLSGRCHGAAQDTVGSELRESIKAVRLSTTQIKFESAAISVFVQLRLGCLHCICVPEAFDCEAGSVPVVCSISGSISRKKNGVHL